MPPTVTVRLGAVLRPLLLVLGTVALVAGATACGGGSAKKVDRQAYVRDVNRAQQDFAAAAARLNLGNPSSAAGFGQSLTRLGAQIDRLVGRLGRLTPPAAVQAEHRRLIASLRTYGAALGRDRGAFVTGDRARIRAGARRIQVASTAFSSTFDSTIRAINTKLRAGGQ